MPQAARRWPSAPTEHGFATQLQQEQGGEGQLQGGKLQQEEEDGGQPQKEYCHFKQEEGGGSQLQQDGMVQGGMGPHRSGKS